MDFLGFVVIGFAAQVIDGALGMAYGVTSTTFLLAMGIPPAPASAAVHTAEVFTTGVSGVSHLRLGNVDNELFRRLVVPGICGGVVGAYVLTAVPGQTIKPFVAVYLLAMGVFILVKSFRRAPETTVRTKLIRLGLAGGFLDAVGGGGWGPIVTSTLVARGNSPRLTIGSINLAEFFVTVAQSAVFLALLGLTNWRISAGLMVGGVIAAPFAAYLCRRLPSRTLMGMVGVLLIVLSTRTIYLALR